MSEIIDYITEKEGIFQDKYIQGNCFELLTAIKYSKLFNGIITDIPFKDCLKGKLGEKQFTFDKFFNMVNFVCKKDSFLITFCNLQNLIDLVNYGRKYNWKLHTYQIRDKSPNRSWISWNLPLRTVELVVYLKRGKYNNFSFKDGTIKKRYNRSSFGGDLRKVGKDKSGNKVSYGMYSDVINAPAVKRSLRRHPTQKPIVFSKMFSKIVESNTIICDPFCGSGVLLKYFPNSLGIDLINYWNRRK